MKYLLFTSNTCKACPQMKQNLSRAGIKYDEFNVNERHNAKIAAMYLVKSLPTLVVTHGGKPLDTVVGLVPVSHLVKFREKYDSK
jgi:thioredoxin-like negative regulator of GroEL